MCKNEDENEMEWSEEEASIERKMLKYAARTLKQLFIASLPKKVAKHFTATDIGKIDFKREDGINLQYAIRVEVDNKKYPNTAANFTNIISDFQTQLESSAKKANEITELGNGDPSKVCMTSDQIVLPVLDPDSKSEEIAKEDSEQNLIRNTDSSQLTVTDRNNIALEVVVSPTQKKMVGCMLKNRRTHPLSTEITMPDGKQITLNLPGKSKSVVKKNQINIDAEIGDKQTTSTYRIKIQDNEYLMKTGPISGYDGFDEYKAHHTILELASLLNICLSMEVFSVVKADNGSEKVEHFILARINVSTETNKALKIAFEKKIKELESKMVA